MAPSSSAEYDIVGDVHGCLHTLRTLLGELGYRSDGGHPDGRRLAFVGDLVNRGAHSEETFLYVMGLVGSGRASTVRGNHDEIWAAEHTDLAQWTRSMPLQILVDDDRLLIVHAAIRADLIGRLDDEAERWCVHGNPTTDAAGQTVRPDWQATYTGEPFVVAGHSVVRRPRFSSNGGGSVIIDTGASHGPNARDRFTGEQFGGGLTAFRWPERTTVSVPTDPADLSG